MARLQVMRDKANDAGFTRVPMVFEGNSLVPLDSENPRQFREELTASGASPVRIRSGAALTVGDIGDLVLYREGGATCWRSFAVVTVTAPALNWRGRVRASGRCGGFRAMSHAAVDVIDFMPNEDGLDVLLEPFWTRSASRSGGGVRSPRLRRTWMR